MQENNNGYKFESTGKQIDTYGAFGFSLSDGKLRVGYDDTVQQYNDEKDLFHHGLTDDERKELAMYEIQKWCDFAEIKAELKI